MSRHLNTLGHCPQKFWQYFVVIGALLLNPISALGAETEMVPAKFAEGEASVTNRFMVKVSDEFKDEDINIKIYCQTLIDSDGMASNTHCIQPEEHASFGEATRTAINGAEFMPARIDGEPVSVLMNLMALVRCKGIAICEAFLLPNHGHNMSEFGLAYSAPQPVLNEQVWYKRFEDKLEWSSGINTSEEVGGIKFMVSVIVEVSGESSYGQVELVESGRREYAYWATRTAFSLNDGNFIPGRYLGQPTDMRLYEYWIDPEAKPYVRPTGWAHNERYQLGWNWMGQGSNFGTQATRSSVSNAIGRPN